MSQFNISGPVALIGVANKYSICYGILECLRKDGVEVLLTYHSPFEKNVRTIAEEFGVTHVFNCDADNHDSVHECFSKLAVHKPVGLVHGIAFSDKNQLRGQILGMTRENFAQTMLISCFSFLEFSDLIAMHMPAGGSIVTLTFEGAEGALPNYNGMGIAKAGLNAAVKYVARDLGPKNIRVNAISASPENTLAARGVGNPHAIGRFAEAMSPLGRRATIEEIANATAFLLSPLSSGINAQIIHVDCGTSGMKMFPDYNADKAQIAAEELRKR
jgi:enoyl-[acyl-carrier protein] reductase I